MRSARKNVRCQGCSAFHRHGLLTSEFKQGHLGRQCAGQRLSMANKTGGGQGEVVTDFEEFLHALVGNEMTHGRTVICANNDASLEGDTDGARPGLHDGLVF